MKQYKRHTPTQTIATIRSILNSIGILLKETHFNAENLYSCRVNIANNGLDSLDIGTNGKGRSIEYSIASACAEFMERLQNHCLLDEHKMLSNKTFGSFSLGPEMNDKDGIIYDKNEKRIPPSELDIDVQADIKTMCGVSDNTDISDVITNKEVLVVPFYDCFKNREVNLPIEFILESTGSNGMAAGNSPKEAILQGICELWERQVVKEIYKKKIVPPIIPLESFKGTNIYEKVHSFIEKTHYEVQVRDCSLNDGIPAIALLIIDRENMRYNFKVGVDFVPEVALERCFTEAHQGRTKFSSLPYSFTDYKCHDLGSTAGEEDSMIKTFINSSGYWPLSILYSTPSYSFKGFNSSLGQSNKTDMEYALAYFNNKGWNVYIRDNSYLGFPAYFIYVPEISQIVRKSSDKAEDSKYSYTESFLNLRDVNRLGRITVEMAKSILNGINDNYEKLSHNDFSISRAFVYNVDRDLNDLSLEMLASLLAFYVGDNDLCVSYLKLYLNGKDKSHYRYYYGCIDYLELSKQIGEEESRKIVSLLYGKDLASEIVEDLSNAQSVFQYYNLPNCPYCDKCKLEKSCKEKDIQKISKRINDISQSNYIQQKKTAVNISDDNE